MRGKATIAASLLTVKPVQESHIPWLGMERIWVSFQWRAMKSSEGSTKTRILLISMRFSFRCLKFIMRRFRIYF